MPLTKKGEQINWKEFFKRWKAGIEGISPTQKLRTQIFGTQIILLGISLGLIFSLFSIKTLWWLAIILLGSLINTIVQYLGYKQQLNVFNQIEEEMKGGKNGS